VSDLEALGHALNEGASGGTFVAGPEKEAIADSQEPIYIFGTDPKTETKFGDQTHFYVKAKSWGTEQRTLAFSHNEFRERQARNVAALVAASEKGWVGPVYLGRFRTQSGNDAWQLGVQPFAPQPKQTEDLPVTAPATPAAAPVADDNDLPF
jgi:hypothetical protein